MKVCYCEHDSASPMDLKIHHHPYRNPGRTFSVEIDKLILKFVWKCKKPKTAKIILKKKKVGELTPFNFKTLYKARVPDRVVLA